MKVAQSTSQDKLAASANRFVAEKAQWFVTRGGIHKSQMRIGYGTPEHRPQYAVLHMKDSYMRLSHGPTCGWGTSFIVMPSFWSDGALRQGYPVTATWAVICDNLVLNVTGRTGDLTVTAAITITPPFNDAIEATVVATTSGFVAVDIRPGEAFRPVFLSSMNVSDTSFDCAAVIVGDTKYPMPNGDVLVPGAPVVSSKSLGLVGGSSAWKKNAPTVTVTLSRPMQIAGWVTPSSNPNDDNVGLWAASDSVLREWSYRVRAEAAAYP